MYYDFIANRIIRSNYLAIVANPPIVIEQHTYILLHNYDIIPDIAIVIARPDRMYNPSIIFLVGSSYAHNTRRIDGTISCALHVSRKWRQQLCLHI